MYSLCFGNLVRKVLSSYSLFLTQIVFDRDGIPRAAFQEDAKKRVPIDAIVDEVKKMSVSK